MRPLAALVLPPLFLALASACGGAVAQSLEGPPPDGGTDATPPVNQNCGANMCPGYVEAPPAAGNLCGTEESCCPALNASHVGETRSFSCGNGAFGTAVCRPSPRGGAGTWAVTSPCTGSTGTGACTYAADPSPKAVTSYGACGEGVNITAAPATNCGGAGAAFEYVPQIDTIATRIELFTTPGVVALLDSDSACDKPGALLFQHELDGASRAIGWRGADVYPPIALKAQHKYFLHMAPGANGSIACSIAQSGVFVREYTGAPGGPWEGPFSGSAWMGRVVGLCP